MAQAYSDPNRESDPYALPDLEVFHNAFQQCTMCGALNLRTLGDWDTCPECGDDTFETGKSWFWWSCLPGCLPDSEPFGPFATEAEALADAREMSGED
jgi:hypothetical protein